MTSTTHAAANAANAHLANGPRTGAGKARSRNAVSHGLASRQNFIMPGEEPAVAAMHDTLLDQLAPRRWRRDDPVRTRLQRDSAHHQRSFNSALRTLRTLQAERLARRAAAGHQDPIPALVPVAEIDKRTRQITKRNGMRGFRSSLLEMKMWQSNLNKQTQKAPHFQQKWLASACVFGRTQRRRRPSAPGGRLTAASSGCC